MIRPPRFEIAQLTSSRFVLLVSILVLVGCEKETAKPVRYREADYQQAWIDRRGGTEEVRMSDNTRADIVTDTHAIEVDFAEKWAESIGQSLHYARLKNLQAGVLLIIDEEDDSRYLERWQSVVDKHDLPIDLYIIDADFEIQRVE